MLTKAHHACKKDGGYEFVMKESPFFAEHKPSEGKVQFLGSGYYFWDNNRELAKTWGKNHYDNDYFVLEFDLGDDCLDLVGNRESQIFIQKALDKLEGNTSSKWSICQCIEFLKKLGESGGETFPYRSIRAIDLHRHSKIEKQVVRRFVDNKENYTILNSKIVICAIDRKAIPLETKKLIFMSI